MLSIKNHHHDQYLQILLDVIHLWIVSSHKVDDIKSVLTFTEGKQAKTRQDKTRTAILIKALKYIGGRDTTKQPHKLRTTIIQPLTKNGIM
jgi:hypothetical protein